MRVVRQRSCVLEEKEQDVCWKLKDLRRFELEKRTMKDITLTSKLSNLFRLLIENWLVHVVGIFCKL